MDKVKDTLRAYIAEHFDAKDDPDFTDDVNLFDFGFVDSLGATEILLYMEQPVSYTHLDVYKRQVHGL